MTFDFKRKRVLLIGGPYAGRLMIVGGAQMDVRMQEMPKGIEDKPRCYQYWITTMPVMMDDGDNVPFYLASLNPPSGRNIMDDLLKDYVRACAQANGGVIY